MTICLLVRHAAFDFGIDHLAGRTEYGISAAGEEQAKALTRALPRRALLHSSPRLRCLQTIAPHAAEASHPITVVTALDEIDFGTWTARTFASLDCDPSWQLWNAERTTTRAPGGEFIVEVQERILRHITDTAAENPGGAVVMVTHAELIRAVVLHCHSLSLNDWRVVDIPHASVTKIAVGRSGQMIVDQRIAA